MQAQRAFGVRRPDAAFTNVQRGGVRFVLALVATVVGLWALPLPAQADVPSGDALLRLRVSKTPTSSADPSGSVGSFAWDDNYVYVKTSTGWKRSSLTTF
jgi:hypothetical protein